jgi:hypothetical protein
MKKTFKHASIDRDFFIWPWQIHAKCSYCDKIGHVREMVVDRFHQFMHLDCYKKHHSLTDCPCCGGIAQVRRRVLKNFIE